MKKITLLIGFVCFFILQSRADFILSQFSIPDGYLSNGKFQPNTGFGTPFVADVMMMQGENNVLSPIKLTIVYVVGGVETAVSNTFESSSSSWLPPNTLSARITAIFPPDHTPGGKIYLKIQAYRGGNLVREYLSTVNYSIDETPNSTVHNPFSPKYNVVNYGSYDGAPVGPAPFWFPDTSIPVISRGQKIYSANGQYVLDFQAYDGNLVLYKVSTGQALWATNKSGGQYLMFHTDGNLIMYNANNTQIIWTSDIYITPPSSWIATNAYLRLQDDGDLVLKWNGRTFTDIFGSTGTSGGVYSPRYGKMKI